MVKRDKFDSAIESSLSDIKNDVIQALREENINLKNRIKTLEA